ncbi:MAG TPA: NAD(P)/FAD-dependent oxidoreductase [Candidatus Deferrimicrobiaceae bacterium]
MILDAVVVGGGIGGLACAGALAARGRSVLVLEQAASPGGYLASFRRDGFIFDAAVDCVAGLDPEGLITWLLRSLGVERELGTVRLDPIRHSRYPGLSVEVDADLSVYIERLCALFPSERQGILAHFRRMETIYADVGRELQSVREGRGGAKAFPSSFAHYGNATYSDLLREDISDRRLAAVLSDRCPFLGISPDRVSAIRLSTLVMSYFRSGAFRPVGGHQRLADALVKGIRGKRGAFLPGRAARRILVERGRCVGVETEDGERFPTRHVVSNAGPHETFSRLLSGVPGMGATGGAGNRRLSPSFFILYLGVRGGFCIPGSASSIGSFDRFDLASLLDGYEPFRDSDSLGITIPTREDPSLAPPGHHVVLVHELVPQGYTEDWAGRKQVLANRVLGMAEKVLPGVSGGVVCSDAATPATLERYTRNRGGAAFGWEHTPGFRKEANGLPNLHFAGHWCEVGGGVLAAAYTGVRAANRVMEADG